MKLFIPIIFFICQQLPVFLPPISRISWLVMRGQLYVLTDGSKSDSCIHVQYWQLERGIQDRCYMLSLTNTRYCPGCRIRYSLQFIQDVLDEFHSIPDILGLKPLITLPACAPVCLSVCPYSSTFSFYLFICLLNLSLSLSPSLPLLVVYISAAYWYKTQSSDHLLNKDKHYRVYKHSRIDICV